MKQDLYAKYQGLGYEEGFGPDEVLVFQQNKRQIDIYAIINESGHFERQIYFGEDEGLGHPFLTCYSCLAENMEQLNNALALSTNQGLTIGLSFNMQVAHVEVITFSPVVQVHVL